MTHCSWFRILSLSKQTQTTRICTSSKEREFWSMLTSWNLLRVYRADFLLGLFWVLLVQPEFVFFLPLLFLFIFLFASYISHFPLLDWHYLCSWQLVYPNTCCPAERVDSAPCMFSLTKRGSTWRRLICPPNSRQQEERYKGQGEM